MAARSEYFHSYHSPVLSAEQNSSQSEEINVRDESRAENRPVFVQQLKYDGKKFPWSAVMFVVLSGCSRDNSRSALTVPVRWVACKGGLCFNPSRRVARLAGAPSFQVNRLLRNCGAASVGVLQDNLVLSTGLIMWFATAKRFENWCFER